MYHLSVLVLDGPSPVAVCVLKGNSHSASDVDVTASYVTSGNSNSDASNIWSPNKQWRAIATGAPFNPSTITGYYSTQCI